MSRPFASRAAAPLGGLLAPIFATWAVIAADIGWTRMASQGVICGASAPHCAWCYAAGALALAAITSVVVTVRPLVCARRPAARRASSSCLGSFRYLD